MQVMLMRLMSKGEYLIVPKGTKFTGAGKLGLKGNEVAFLRLKLVYNREKLNLFSNLSQTEFKYRLERERAK